MRTHIALGVACVGIVSTLALSACTRGPVEVAPSPEPVAVTNTATPDAVDPTTPVAPSFPAGISTSEPSPSPAPADPMLDASAVLTLATVDPDTGGLLVGGFVSGLMEDGGDCQYVITSTGGDAVTVHKDGIANNGSTSCGSVTVSKSRVPTGSYSVVLRYVDAKGEAVSDAVKVDVP